jgi:hypothetical protein
MFENSQTHSRPAFRTAAFLTLACVSLSAAGCGKGKKVPGLEGFEVHVIQSRLNVGFTSTTLQLDGGFSLEHIPGLRDASVSIGPDLNSGGTVFLFSIGLASLLNDGRELAPAGLPDGRPLPDVVGGALPHWSVAVKGLELDLYLSDDAFGLFVPLKFLDKSGKLLLTTVSVEIIDERGNRLGKVYAIPSNVSGSGSGLFILLPYLGSPSGSGLG